MYLPPVNIPSLSDHDYSKQLYGMIAGVGDSYYGAKRDKVGDAQFQQEQERLSTAQALGQSNADRNYAFEMDKWNWEKEQAAAGGGGEYGLNGIWGYDPKNKTWGVFQPSTAGGAASQVQFPVGYTPQPPTGNVNLGTVNQPVATRGGIPMGPGQEIDVAGQNTAQVAGTAQGEAAANLPLIEAQTSTLLGEIDNVLTDPNLPSLTGIVGGTLPAWSFTGDPGGMNASQANITQLVQRSFLQAYNQLKGAGAITEREGQAAMDAMTTLRTQNMDDASYVTALQKFRSEVVKMLDVARARAQGGGNAPAQGGQIIPLPGGYGAEILEE